jgi:hypothetical protein
MDRVQLRLFTVPGVHVSILRVPRVHVSSTRADNDQSSSIIPHEPTQKTESAIFDLIFGLVALEGSKISQSS